MSEQDDPKLGSRLTCSTCGRRFLRDESDALPFCSQRCRMIDLGRWFDEEIGLPYEGPPGDTPVEYRDADQMDDDDQ